MGRGDLSASPAVHLICPPVLLSLPLPGRSRDTAKLPTPSLLKMEAQKGYMVCLISPLVPKSVSGRPQGPPSPSGHLSPSPCRPSITVRSASAPRRRPSESSLTRAPPTSGCLPPSAAPCTRPVVRPGPGASPATPAGPRTQLGTSCLPLCPLPREEEGECLPLF